MTRIGNCIALVLAGVILASSLGCKRNNQSSAGGTLPPEVQAAQRLPEGTNILTALEQKDYEGAVAGLAKLQPVAGTEGALAPDYFTLKMYVKGKLVELAPTDPKAAEALNSVRALTQGR